MSRYAGFIQRFPCHPQAGAGDVSGRFWTLTGDSLSTISMQLVRNCRINYFSIAPINLGKYCRKVYKMAQGRRLVSVVSK